MALFFPFHCQILCNPWVNRQIVAALATGGNSQHKFWRKQCIYWMLFCDESRHVKMVESSWFPDGVNILIQTYVVFSFFKSHLEPWVKKQNALRNKTIFFYSNAPAYLQKKNKKNMNKMPFKKFIFFLFLQGPVCCPDVHTNEKAVLCIYIGG